MNKDTELQKLANRIKAIRLEKKLSQEELAHRCDFDRTYISLLERAKRNPSYFNLIRLCVGLEISVSELLKDL
jgi:transcriptional regulator with XRE-family HTH domain